MSDPRRPEDIQAEAARLRAEVDGANRSNDALAGKSSALRIATDLMVCLGVGVFLGYWADRWLDSAPWGILLGICFGMAAGVRNAIRSAKAMEKSEENRA